ncbi:RHS repeat-associated core domain-containing protein, partial [Pseudomonas delhiensis]
ERTYYFHTDQIGTPLDVTDEDGKPVWQATYKAWGEVEGYAAEEIEQNLRFQGQYFDAETGLHYNTFRYYDPVVGRFLTQDPIGLYGGINLFRFSPNPYMWIDPLGLTMEWVDPRTINFSQRTISRNNYAEIMKSGGWDWERSPLHVIDVDGQLVSYDNRRLDAALEADLKKVSIIKESPDAPHPDSATGKTWKEKFQQRFNDRRNIRAGGPVPRQGVRTRPTVC